MLLDACSDGEYVYVKYDVVRIDSSFFCKESICSFADLYLAVIGRSLAFLVKCHYDHGCSK